jgi:hypothetical protein
VIRASNWRAVSTGAALEAARRVATMVEMIETFILGFERIYYSFQDEILERIVFFFYFSWLRDFELFRLIWCSGAGNILIQLGQTRVLYTTVDAVTAIPSIARKQQCNLGLPFLLQGWMIARGLTSWYPA